jgi:hypothetical protein
MTGNDHRKTISRAGPGNRPHGGRRAEMPREIAISPTLAGRYVA